MACYLFSCMSDPFASQAGRTGKNQLHTVYNMGLEPMTLRIRVSCFTAWVNQADAGQDRRNRGTSNYKLGCHSPPGSLAGLNPTRLTSWEDEELVPSLILLELYWSWFCHKFLIVLSGSSISLPEIKGQTSWLPKVLSEGPSSLTEKRNQWANPHFNMPGRFPRPLVIPSWPLQAVKHWVNGSWVGRQAGRRQPHPPLHRKLATSSFPHPQQHISSRTQPKPWGQGKEDEA